MADLNRSSYAVLGMVSFMPMSGYDIKKHIDNSISHFWSENYGHIYPVLASLEKRGLVRLLPVKKGPRPGRERKVYTSTPEGSAMLLKWLHEPAAPEYFRIELLLKLFFGLYTEPSVSIRGIEREKAHCRKTLDNFAKLEKHIKAEGEGPQSLYGLLCLEYGKAHYAAIEKWCGHAELVLKKIKNKKTK